MAPAFLKPLSWCESEKHPQLNAIHAWQDLERLDLAGCFHQAVAKAGADGEIFQVARL